jgi:hypothetical protein
MIVASGGREGRGAKGYVEDALNQARGDRETDEAIVTLVSKREHLRRLYDCWLMFHLCYRIICMLKFLCKRCRCLFLIVISFASNVTEFDFGQEYPVFSSARVRPSNESGKVVSYLSTILSPAFDLAYFAQYSASRSTWIIQTIFLLV